MHVCARRGALREVLSRRQSSLSFVQCDGDRARYLSFFPPNISNFCVALFLRCNSYKRIVLETEETKGHSYRRAFSP